MRLKLIFPFCIKLGMVLLSVIALFYIAVIGKTILLGDERDEKQPGTLSIAIKEDNQIKTSST